MDFAAPVGLQSIASLHNLVDADDPAGVVGKYLAVLAPGSYVVISHVTGDFAPEQMAQVTASLAERGSVFIGRTRAQMTDMFNGRELVDPGVVQLSSGVPTAGGRPERGPGVGLRGRGPGVAARSSHGAANNSYNVVKVTHISACLEQAAAAEGATG